MTHEELREESLGDKWLYSFNELRSFGRFSFCLGVILATAFWLTLYGVFFA